MASSCVMFSSDICVICRIAFIDSSDKDISEVGRGLSSLIEYSEKYSDNDLHEYLLSNPPVVRVHNSCRRNFTNKCLYEQQCAKNVDEEVEGESVQKKSLRSSTPSFDFKTHCFFLF